MHLYDIAFMHTKMGEPQRAIEALHEARGELLKVRAQPSLDIQLEHYVSRRPPTHSACFHAVWRTQVYFDTAPEMAGCSKQLVKAYLEAGQLDEALKWLLKATQQARDPRSPDLRLAARLFAAEAMHEEKRKFMDKVLADLGSSIGR